MVGTVVEREDARMRAGSLGAPRSDSKQAAEASGGVIGLRAVVIREDRAVASVAEERATQLADVGGRLNPARCLQVEFAERLQRAVLLLGEQLDAQGLRHRHCAVLRFGFLAGLES